MIEVGVPKPYRGIEKAESFLNTVGLMQHGDHNMQM